MFWNEKWTEDKIKDLADKVDYFSPHNHTEISNYRLRDCIIKISQLIDRAIELGYNGVCCTDHEALSGHIQFIKRYKEINKLYKEYEKIKNEPQKILDNKDIKKNLHLLEKYNPNFKIGLGNEIYLIDSIEDVTVNYVSGETQFYHFILIAKDKQGYEQIKQISSESAWKNWFKRGNMERVPTIKSELEEIIGNNKGHIIALSACLGSELDTLIIKYYETKDKIYLKKIENFISWAIKIFGKDNFYLEIQPCVIKQDENGENILHNQAIVDKFMFYLSNQYGLKVCCSTDSHYLLKEDAKIHEAYLKADDEDKKNSREVASFYETTFMASKEELVRMFQLFLTEEEIVKAFNGTKDLYDKIEIFDLYHPTIVPTDKKIPEFKLKHTLKDYYDKYEYINKYSQSDNKQDKYLLYLIEKGMDNLNQWGDSKFHFITYDYDGNIISEEDKIVTQEEKIARINEELSSFWQISERLEQKLSSYYVLVRGLIHEVMWPVSFVGVARGSCGGSYVCYLIEITQINPLKYDLPFWRHSSPLRPELPD